MREKFTWLAIAALLLVTIYHACDQQRRSAAAKEMAGRPLRPGREGAYADQAADSQWAEFKKWQGRVAERMERGEPLLPPDFDAFFGDAFFAGRKDPFAELERIRLLTSEELRGPGKGLFERNWDGWFEQRLRMGGFATSVEAAADGVTLTVRVPGLVPGSASAEFSRERIKLAFTAVGSAEIPSSGGKLRKESAQSYTKLLPVPEGAAPGSGRLETAGDKIRLRFSRAR